MGMAFATMALAATLTRSVSSPSFQTVTSTRMVAAAQARLVASLGSNGARAQVSVVGKPEDVTVLPGRLVLDARKPGGRLPRERIGIAVDVRVNAEVVRTATVWFAVSVHRDVLGYSVDAPRGSLAAALKLSRQDADVAAVHGDLVVDPAQLNGMRLRHAVLAGSPVLLQDFERIPDVDRQERVEVDVAYGAIRMQTKGTAQAPGSTGSTVPVLVDGADVPVRARVTGKGVVEVDQ